jgi:hypothetical protein
VGGRSGCGSVQAVELLVLAVCGLNRTAMGEKLRVRLALFNPLKISHITNRLTLGRTRSASLPSQSRSVSFVFRYQHLAGRLIAP